MKAKKTPSLVVLALTCILLLSLTVVGNSCVIGDAGPCLTDRDCERYAPLFCSRGWCVPRYIRDLAAKADARKDAGIVDGANEGVVEPIPEVTSDLVGVDQVPETGKDEPTDPCPGACKIDDTRPCYPGDKLGCSPVDPKASTCLGLCKPGAQICTKKTGTTCPDWGSCEGGTFPVEEICDGLDNDCDGQVDNKLNAPKCAKQDGLCSLKVKVCDGANGWKECTAAEYGADYEEKETKCDGKDNDCNGQVDENCTCKTGETQSCFTGAGGCINNGGTFVCQGICKAGQQVCVNNKWGNCLGEVPAEAETCDGKDNDCDGQIDNNLTAPPCANQKGVCAGKTKACDGANGWKACTAAEFGADYEAKETKCDGKDNDCDGQIDNNLTAPDCANQKGVCKGKKQSCDGAKGWQACTAAEYGTDYEATETKCDGKDNDCDGQFDNGLNAPACALTKGVCAGTKQVCDGANGWKACTSATYGADYEATETKCDGKDNDCDGQNDEGCNCTDGQKQPCFNGSTGCTRNGSSFNCKGVCTGGEQTCSGGSWGSCVGEVVNTVEICDGEDNDCDGQIDNNLTAPNCAKQAGVCSGKKQICGGKSGWKACTAAEYGTDYEATETKCDGKDNDCDGQVDNNLTAPACALTQGVCANTKQACGGTSGWLPCTATSYGTNYEVKETKCDGLDNDCNGTPDDGLTAPLCANQVGVCQGKTQSCGGTSGWKACTAAEYGTDYETTETKCDNKDNDCNGKTDNGCVVTFAGLAGTSGSADGTGTAARFKSPTGLAIDGTGNLYVADSDNHTIRKITPAGVVTTIAGKVGEAGFADRTTLQSEPARFNMPKRLTIDSFGNLYVLDVGNLAVRKIDAAGLVTTLSTNQFVSVGLFDIAVCGTGFLCFGDTQGTHILQMNLTTMQSTVLEMADCAAMVHDPTMGLFYINGLITPELRVHVYQNNKSTVLHSFSGGQAPVGLALYANHLYISDKSEHTIQRYDIALKRSFLYAGTKSAFGTTNGKALGVAKFNAPEHLVVDAAGNVYIADTGNHAIRKIIAP